MYHFRLLQTSNFDNHYNYVSMSFYSSIHQLYFHVLIQVVQYVVVKVFGEAAGLISTVSEHLLLKRKSVSFGLSEMEAVAQWAGRDFLPKDPFTQYPTSFLAPKNVTDQYNTKRYYL